MHQIFILSALFSLICHTGNATVKEVYEQHCMSCHGETMAGGLGSSLLDASAWNKVGPDLSFIEYVQAGDKEVGMPGFEATLSEADIRGLQVYIEEARYENSRSQGKLNVPKKDGEYTAGGYTFRLENVIEDGLTHPWSLAFLSDTKALITERAGDLRVWDQGVLSEPVQGTPTVTQIGQGGLLEVAAHPDYAQNGWIYLGFAATAEGAPNPDLCSTKIVRGRIVDNQWRDETVIFEVPAKFHRTAGVHYGTRFVFQDGYLFFSLGDRGAQDHAQDLTHPNGKIHRIHDDGRVPTDNPFVDTEKAYASIWSCGHRNPQGLSAHPRSGALFASEHGPRGGDEINHIQRGLNYGWPLVTFGINYNGTPITDATAAPGMESPLHHWTPSIAVCGIDFYAGDAFPDWTHNLFVGGLSKQELHRLVIQDNQVVRDEIILKNEGRVRDVVTGPDGFLYVVFNQPDSVARLVPVPVEAPHPNIVFIMADDLGYGDLSAFGQTAYETPHIDRIAEEGVLATDYYVPVPYCGPSRGALITGRFPFRNGMTRNPHPDTTPAADLAGLNPDELTLGEAFQAAGYKTIAIGKWHLGHQPQYLPTRRGFDEYYGILYSNDMLPIQLIDQETAVEDPVDQRYLTLKYTDRAIDFIENHTEEPFFLYLSHSMPHKPLAVSEEFYTPETPDDLYHDVIREMDASLGRVVETLKQHNLLDNTVVIFTSDNGPHFGGSTGGFKGKKATPWEGGTRVPFMIRYPAAMPVGKSIATPIWSIDLFPTLLALAGIPLPEDIHFDGEDIQDILRGERTTHRPIFTAQDQTIITIRDGDWKLYVNEPRYLTARDLNPDWVDPKWPNGTTILAQDEQPSSMQYPGVIPKRFENPLPLFNIAKDPTESTDLAARHPEVVSRLRKQYEAFLATMPAP